MKIVVAGIGKSGTTALTYKIAAALPEYGMVFEPVRRRRSLETSRHTLAKIKLRSEGDYQLAQEYRDFDRKILLSRDPRDWLISRQLYLWYSRDLPRAQFEAFLAALRRKEAASCSVAFLDLSPSTLRLDQELAKLGSFVGLHQRLTGEGWFGFRYEDMVAGHFEALDAYLGIKVDATAEVDTRHRRVVRSKAAGNWRHWLTPADVQRLRPLLDDSLEALGYDTGNWQLARAQVLDPSLGSAYVERLRGTPLQRRYRLMRRQVRNLLRT